MNAKSADERIYETRESAIALYEDFHLLREISYRVETRPVDLRNASAILRRWLVEDDLGRIASARVGRLHLLAIDNTSIYRAERRGGIVVFVSGGARIHGIYLAAGMVNEGARAKDIPDYHPDKLSSFKLDTFVKQRVIYTQGEWFTRQQVIKFVANADNGVHGHGPRTDWERKLSGFRHEVAVSIIVDLAGQQTPTVTWQLGSPARAANPAEYDPNRVNGVLLELLATMHFLVQSPELIALINVIRTEIS